MGFLDTDYEGSDGEFSDYESEILAETQQEVETETGTDTDSDTGTETKPSSTVPCPSLSQDPRESIFSIDDPVANVCEYGASCDKEEGHNEEEEAKDESYFEELSPSPCGYVFGYGFEWEDQVHSHEDDESAVIEHMLLCLESYLSNQEDEDDEEKFVVDMHCTIWTVYDENNKRQFIIDGEPIVLK